MKYARVLPSGSLLILAPLGFALQTYACSATIVSRAN